MTLPSKLVDLSSMFGPVRDQGQRPTCLAFAASDSHAAVRGVWEALSPEYVFRKAQQRDGRRLTEGATLAAIAAALKDDGQPTETDAPYVDASSVSGAWPLPSPLSVFKRNSRIAPPTFDAIVGMLDAGSPCVALICLSMSFYTVGSDALIDDVPSDPPDPNRRHAVVALGHGTALGKRVMLIRNSWGPGWASGGYAWLTEAFIQPRLYGVTKMMEDLSVPANSNTA